MTVLPAELLAQHIAIVGKTGSGKTYTAKGLVERLLADKRRVCILDPTGVWWGLRASADGKRDGFPVVVFGGPHADVPIAERSGGTLAKIIATKNVPAIIDLSEMLVGERHRFVTDFAEALYRDNRAPLHLVIDEADEFSPQNPLPETKRMLHHVDRIVRRGRVRGFRVMLITQRPAVLHKNVLTQANTLIALRLTAPQDRKAIMAWIEGQADAAQGKEVLASLARLKRGEGWVWAPEIDLLRRTTFPTITTFDSSRAPNDDELVAEPSKLADVALSEIEASFETVEAEQRTLDELRAEVTALRRKLTLAEKAQASNPVPKPEVQVVQAGLPTKTLRAVAAAIAALQAVETASGGGAPAPAPVGDATAAQPPRATLSSRATAAPARAPVSAGLTGPEQRILDAIAWLESVGVAEPEQPAVAFLAGYSYGGGAYNNPRGRLNQRCFVEYRPGERIRLTDAGRARANVPAAPASNDELHERVLARLGGPEQRLLRPLLAAYPESLSNEDLARAAGYTPGAGAYNNPRGRLRSLGLIDYPQPGRVVARALMFPMGKL